MADDKPIIVVKKKGGHGGHHGGAWKIAYADFVTAMMAFFMVMWLVNSASSPTKESIASYFRKPGIFNEGSGTPLLIGGAGILEDAFVPPRPEDKSIKSKNLTQNPQPRKSGESAKDLDKIYQTEGRAEPEKNKGPDENAGLNSDKDQIKVVKKEYEIVQERKLKKAIDQAQQQFKLLIQQNPGMAQILGKLDVKVEADGLRIEIMDTDKVSMFDSGSARIRRDAEEAFARVTEVIKKFPNQLDVSGHTDSKPFPSRTGQYTNWELSADRANAARRLIEGQGFPSTQVGSVIGRASTEPKTPEDPLSPSNRRITLKMKFDLKKLDEQTPSGDAGKALDDLLGGPMPQGTPAKPGPTEAPPTPTPTPTPEQEVSTNDAQRREPKGTPTPTKDRIRLPDGTPITSNPDYMPHDKIFNNDPVVVGPAEVYSR